MQKILLACLLLMVSAGSAAGHGGISNLPDSVQIMQYKMLLYIDPDDAETKNNLAMAYFRTNELGEAIKHLEEVLARDANNFDALDGMGIVLIRQGKAAEALEYFERAKVINDNDPHLYVHLHLAYSQLNQADLAEQSLKTAEILLPGPEGAAEIQREISLIRIP
jgi:tetratricopeptide (TPR) repeat protein